MATSDPGQGREREREREKYRELASDGEESHAERTYSDAAAANGGG